MPRMQKVVVWDIDGPINSRHTPSAFVYKPPESNPDAIGGDPTDFVINNLFFLDLTLQVLQRNNVVSVIGSQRIQMTEDDPKHSPYVRAMYAGLDEAFGVERPYLQKDVATKIGKELQATETNATKNDLLAHYQAEFKVQPSQMILIDDHAKYNFPATKAGYGFIHAPRPPQSGTVEDNAYLFEVLIRTVPILDIYQSLESAVGSQASKNAFKQQLLEYQFKHLQNVYDWQYKLQTDNQSPANSSHEGAELSPIEMAAKNILAIIQRIIMDTKWKVSFLGGEGIQDLATRQIYSVPKGMLQMLNEVDLARRGKKTWVEALSSVKVIADEATKRKDGIFHRRGQTSTHFYQQSSGLVTANDAAAASATTSTSSTQTPANS